MIKGTKEISYVLFLHVIIFLRKMESKSAGPDNSQRSREISRLRFAALGMIAWRCCASIGNLPTIPLSHCPTVSLFH